MKIDSVFHRLLLSCFWYQKLHDAIYVVKKPVGKNSRSWFHYSSDQSIRKISGGHVDKIAQDTENLFFFPYLTINCDFLLIGKRLILFFGLLFFQNPKNNRKQSRQDSIDNSPDQTTLDERNNKMKHLDSLLFMLWYFKIRINFY